MGLQCLFASVISNKSRNICWSQSGAIRVYSVWHAWVLRRSAGWRGTTLDLSPAGKLSCEQFFSCEMDSPPVIQQAVRARMIPEDSEDDRQSEEVTPPTPHQTYSCSDHSVGTTVPNYVWARVLPPLSWFWCRGGDHGTTLGRRRQRSVGGNARRCPRQPGSGAVSTGMSPARPRGAAAQRRLSAEPRTPFLLQMYCWDLVVQQLQSLTWLFLMAWLFDVAVFYFYFCGEKILSSNHTYLIAAIGATLNGPCLSSVMVMIGRLCLQWEF